MFDPNERLLCLHSEDGRESVVFRVFEEDYDPPIGCEDIIQNQRYRVIRAAQVEVFQDGNSYWTIHAMKVAHRCH